MAKDLEDIKQVMDFIVRIQPEAAAKYAADMEDLNRKRELLHKAAETKSTEATDQETSKRLSLATSELDKLERETISHHEKELSRIERLRQANEDRYAGTVKLAKDAAMQEKEIKDALVTDDEKRNYEQYTRNKAVLDKKQRDLEATKGEDVAGGKSPQFLAPIAKEAIAGAAGGGAVGPVMEMVSNISNPMMLLSVVVKDIAGLIREGVEDARKRDAAMIQLLSVSVGGYGMSGKMNFLDMENIQGRLEAAVPSEQRGQVNPALQSMARSSPETFNKTIGEVEARFQVLIGTADVLNMGWAEAATKIGEISRKTGETFEHTSMTLLEANAAFRQKMQETGQTFDLTKLRQNFTDLYDSMKIYNGTLPVAASMVGRFANELDKGILSLSDIIQLNTGMAKADDGQRAFMMHSFITSSQGHGGVQGDAASKLASMTQMNPVAMAEAMKRMVEGNDQDKASMAAKLGMNPEAMRSMMVGFGLDFTRQQAQQISGNKNDLVTDPIMRQLRVSAGLEKEGMTYEGERSLERDRRGAGVNLPQFTGQAKTDMESTGILRDASRALLEPTITGIKQGFKEVVYEAREMWNGTAEKLIAAQKENRTIVNVSTDSGSTVNKSVDKNKVDVSIHQRHVEAEAAHRAAGQNSNAGY